MWDVHKLDKHILCPRKFEEGHVNGASSMFILEMGLEERRWRKRDRGGVWLRGVLMRETCYWKEFYE